MSNLFEFNCNYNGSSYVVLYGEYVNGYFCCIPSENISCDMAEPNDLFYNRESLEKSGIESEFASVIVSSIKNIHEKDRNKDIQENAASEILNKGEEDKYQSYEKTLCALYETEGQEHAIMQYPNGLFYNHYGYNSQTNVSDSVAGGYSSFEEAEKMMYKHRKYAFKTAYRADVPIRTPAENLPSGWQWVKYNDGSGHLESPDGQDYFSYDWTTGEYKITRDKSYDSFMVENYESGGYSIGGFDKFQEYAEKYINDNVLSKEKSIREVLESKRDKRDTGFETEKAARIQENTLFNMDRGIK